MIPYNTFTGNIEIKQNTHMVINEYLRDFIIKSLIHGIEDKSFTQMQANLKAVDYYLAGQIEYDDIEKVSLFSYSKSDS